MNIEEKILGVAAPEDVVDFDSSIDFLPTEEEVDENEFEAFTPSFMQE